jgi:hypothetical protein
MPNMPGSPTIQDFLNAPPPTTIPSATAPVENYTPAKNRRRLPLFKIGAIGVFMLLLIVGAVAAVVLTQRNQESRSRASIGQYPEVVITQTATTTPGSYDVSLDGTTMPVGTTISSMKVTIYLQPAGAGGYSTPVPFDNRRYLDSGSVTPAEPTNGEVKGVSTEIAQAPTVTNQDFPTLDNKIAPVATETETVIAPSGNTIVADPTESSRIYCNTRDFTGCPAGQSCYQPPSPVCKEGENCIAIVPRAYCRTTGTPVPQMTPVPQATPVSQITPAPQVTPVPAREETPVYQSTSGLNMYAPTELLSSLQFSDMMAAQNPDGSVKIVFAVKVTGQALQDAKIFQGKLKFLRIAVPSTPNKEGTVSSQRVASVVAQSIMGYRPGSSVVTELYEPNLPKPTIQPTVKPTIQPTVNPTSQPTSEPVIPCGTNGSCPAGYSCVTPQAPPTNCVEKPGVTCPKLMPAMPRCVKNPEPTTKPAAYDPAKCWSSVVAGGTGIKIQYYWPSSCKGILNTTAICKTTKVTLTTAEVTQYKAWVSAGKPALASCSVKRATPVPSPSLRPTIVPTIRPSPTVAPKPSPTTTPIWRRIIPGVQSSQPTTAPAATPRATSTTQPWYTTIFGKNK